MHDTRGQATQGSAAWVLVIVSVLAFIVGAILFTTTDPVIQSLFDSPQWTANTADGQNLLNWLERTWAFLPAAILIMILRMVWIETRQPQ